VASSSALPRHLIEAVLRSARRNPSAFLDDASLALAIEVQLIEAGFVSHRPAVGRYEEGETREAWAMRVWQCPDQQAEHWAKVAWVEDHQRVEAFVECGHCGIFSVVDSETGTTRVASPLL
jgi:hypothetical protein